MTQEQQDFYRHYQLFLFDMSRNCTWTILVQIQVKYILDQLWLENLYVEESFLIIEEG